MDISGTPLRAVRAALFTAFVVTLGAAAHVLLSGVPLPLGTLGTVTGAVFVVAYALAGRERAFGRIAALLIPLELAADTVFTTGQHACYGATGGPVTGPLRSVGIDVLCGGGPMGGGLVSLPDRTDAAAAALAQAGPGAGWLLLAGHVGVGLLAAAWLSRGERALARLLRACAVAAFRPLLVAVAATATGVRPVRHLPLPVSPAVRIPLSRFLSHSLARRGPPCPAAVA